MNMLLYRKIKNKLVSQSYCYFNILNKISFLLNGVNLRGKIKTYGKIQIKNVNGKITIGDNVTINSASWANPIGGGMKTQFQIVGQGEIHIGSNTGISNTAITSASTVCIGSNVLLGSGVRIFDTDFHPISANDRKKGILDCIKTAPVKIEDNVFIGTDTIILKGVTIGQNSVIGAGSVVTTNVPSHEIWAGNPAHKLKKV